MILDSLFYQEEIPAFQSKNCPNPNYFVARQLVVIANIYQDVRKSLFQSPKGKVYILFLHQIFCNNFQIEARFWKSNSVVELPKIKEVVVDLWEGYHVGNKTENEAFNRYG